MTNDCSAGRLDWLSEMLKCSCRENWPIIFEIASCIEDDDPCESTNFPHELLCAFLILRNLWRTSEGAFMLCDWTTHLTVWPRFPWFSLYVCVCFLTYVSQTGLHPPTQINTQLQRTSLPFYSFQNKFCFDTAKTLNLQQQNFFCCSYSSCFGYLWWVNGCSYDIEIRSSFRFVGKTC